MKGFWKYASFLLCVDLSESLYEIYAFSVFRELSLVFLDLKVCDIQ